MKKWNMISKCHRKTRKGNESEDEEYMTEIPEFTKKEYRLPTKATDMKIIGGDLNAEFGPGTGVERTSVGHYTLNKENCRGEWMTQWLLEQKLAALNTMFKKAPKNK